MSSYLVFISVWELHVASFPVLMSEGAFMSFLIVLFVLVLIGTYLIVSRYRKYFDNKLARMEAQMNDSSQQQNKKLVIKIKQLEEKLEKNGKEFSELKLENEKLIREVEDIKKQIQELSQNRVDSKKDVIIEYYMKDNES